MPKSTPMNNPRAPVVQNKSKSDVLQDIILVKMKLQAALLRVERLKTEITITERDIKTIEDMKRCLGEEPKTGDLCTHLAKLKEELKAAEADYAKLKEELKAAEADYELNYGKPARWWQLWKRAA